MYSQNWLVQNSAHWEESPAQYHVPIAIYSYPKNSKHKLKLISLMYFRHDVFLLNWHWNQIFMSSTTFAIFHRKFLPLLTFRDAFLDEHHSLMGKLWVIFGKYWFFAISCFPIFSSENSISKADWGDGWIFEWPMFLFERFPNFR